MEPEVAYEVSEPDSSVVAHRNRDELGILIRSKGWEIIATTVQAHIDLRIAALCDPISTMDETLMQEYRKGAVQMARFIKQLPRNMLDDAIAFIENEDEENK